MSFDIEIDAETLKQDGKDILGRLNTLMKEALKNPRGMSFVGLMLGLGIRMTHTSDKFGIKEIEVITPEWTQWHGRSIEAYKEYRERVLNGDLKGSWLLSYENWLRQIYNIPEPEKTRIEKRAWLESPAKNGLDFVIIDIPDDFGEVNIGGVKVDLMPFGGKLYFSDLLLIMSMIGISGVGSK